MEFHEKLQELRKRRGLTQEELAEALFVSRAAVSKWESARGYPSIDSLKEIARYFSVTIDELLSGEKLLSIAEKENKANIQNLCDRLFGMTDMGSFLLIVLPLYPNLTGEYVQAVNLLSYTQTTSFNRSVYWLLFSGLCLLGMIKLFLIKWKKDLHRKWMTDLSMFVHIVAIIFLALAREAYATTLLFLLLLIKGVLYMNHRGSGI